MKALTVNDLIKDLLELRADGFGGASISFFPHDELENGKDESNVFTLDFDKDDHVLVEVDTPDGTGKPEEANIILKFAYEADLDNDDLESLELEEDEEEDEDEEEVF